jgi:hypothetical protein
LKWKSIILSPYGVTALIFLLAFLIAFSWEKALAATFLTAFSIYFLDVIRILYRSPKISLSRIDYYRFEDSIRIFTIVENKGKSVAKYVKPLLTIDDEKLIQLVYAEYSNFHKNGFLVQKMVPYVQSVAKMVENSFRPLLSKLRKSTFAGVCLKLMLELALTTNAIATLRA